MAMRSQTTALLREDEVFQDGRGSKFGVEEDAAVFRQGMLVQRIFQK